MTFGLRGRFSKSLIKTKKRVGARLEPYRTPQVTETADKTEMLLFYSLGPNLSKQKVYELGDCNLPQHIK